jgi:hypothetical protein
MSDDTVIILVLWLIFAGVTIGDTHYNLGCDGAAIHFEKEASEDERNK